MGFDTVISNLVSSSLTYATGFAADYLPILGVVMGIGIFGTIILVVKRFMST